jgi:hypothetical protein
MSRTSFADHKRLMMSMAIALATGAAMLAPAAAHAESAKCKIVSAGGTSQNSGSGPDATCRAEQRTTLGSDTTVSLARVFSSGNTRCRITLNGSVVAEDRTPGACSASFNGTTATATLEP